MTQEYPNGLTITGLRYLTERECEQENWSMDKGAFGIMLSDGSMIYAAQGMESLSPGLLFCRLRTQEFCILTPAQSNMEADHASTI